MIRLYLTSCDKSSEHETGVKLAHYALRDAFGAALPLVYQAGGKPVADSGHFVSISHSDGLCAVTVSDSEIGADIERIRTDYGEKRLMKLAERYFAPDELEYVRTDPRVRFWEIWTAKESFVKLTGEGLSRPLRSFSVLDSGMKFIRFAYNGYTGCICTGYPCEMTDIPTIFVDNAEIQAKD